MGKPYLNLVGVGDALDYLKQVPDCSIDSCCADAPYGLGTPPVPQEVMFAWMRGKDFKPAGTGFMYSSWDAFVPGPPIWKEVYRVLKPGGWCLVFFGTRTYDWGTMAIRFAGFEVQDCISWLFGSGFPKSLNISKAVDAYSVDGKSDSLAIKHANDELRTDTGRVRRDGNSKDGMLNLADGKPKIIRDEPATEDGKRWQGWGTAMKPAQELICMARKPFDGTYARHVLEHGTGALNIDASRIAAGDPVNTHGRWPTNVLFQHLPECQLVGTRRVAAGTAVKRNLPPEGASRRVGNKARTQRGGDITYADADGKEEVADWACAPDCPIAELEHQSRKRGVHGAGCAGYERARGSTGPGQVFDVANGEMFRYGDAGGASRFFYCAKAANKERWSYCRVCKIAFQHDRDRFKEHEAHKDEVISHPTQKPLKLMEYLVRLVTQPGGVVLDPFCGTGSTSVAAKRLGLNFVTCDLSEDYARIARARLGLVGREAESALTSGAYFCPGCKANGEIKLIAKEAVDRMRERGKKTTCVKCMTRYSYEELAQ